MDFPALGQGANAEKGVPVRGTPFRVLSCAGRDRSSVQENLLSKVTQVQQPEPRKQAQEHSRDELLS